ncbi:hypothetical protein [Rhodococcus kronopolitis]|uniref:Uncharacterized protein n=1 Tax=Rhodococcus kronopolitis TaxID=1460226 RepID=A0ABV9FL08_9NOCA
MPAVHELPSTDKAVRPPTHADAIAEFREMAERHPELEIDMEAVLASARYV